MTLDLLADRINVLREIAGIERDLRVFERQGGQTADTIDLRQRLTTARGAVLEQLQHYALLARATTTRH
jgi:hypothetical protein